MVEAKRSKKKSHSREPPPPPPPGGGVLWISSDGDDQRIFFGLKFLIPGFFWVRKFGKYFFVWLDLSGDLSGDFFGTKYNQTCFAVICTGIYLGCVGSPFCFLGVLLFTPFRSSP